MLSCCFWPRCLEALPGLSHQSCLVSSHGCGSCLSCREAMEEAEVVVLLLCRARGTEVLLSLH